MLTSEVEPAPPTVTPGWVAAKALAQASTMGLTATEPRKTTFSSAAISAVRQSSRNVSGKVVRM